MSSLNNSNISFCAVYICCILHSTSSMCGWASFNQLKALRESTLKSPRKRGNSASDYLWTWAATSTLPWVPSLTTYPADFGPVNLHNHITQFILIHSLSFSLSPHFHPFLPLFTYVCECARACVLLVHFYREPWLIYSLFHGVSYISWD